MVVAKGTKRGESPRRAVLCVVMWQILDRGELAV
jgi:hypothetical protein